MAFGLFGKRVAEPAVLVHALDTGGNTVMAQEITVRVRAIGRHRVVFRRASKLFSRGN
jgi:hypothetical protein